MPVWQRDLPKAGSPLQSVEKPRVCPLKSSLRTASESGSSSRPAWFHQHPRPHREFLLADATLHYYKPCGATCEASRQACRCSWHLNRRSLRERAAGE